MRTEPAFQYAERPSRHGYHSHFKNMKERYSPAGTRVGKVAYSPGPLLRLSHTSKEVLS